MFLQQRRKLTDQRRRQIAAVANGDRPWVKPIHLMANADGG
jgi:hypothetical protein